jgi:hypothetical protein
LGGIRLGFEDRAAAGDASLVHGGVQRVIDLLDQHLAERLGSFRAQPALLEVLGQPS